MSQINYETENILNETQNAVETINIKLDPAEERTCELKDRSLEIIPPEEYKKKRMKNSEESLCECGHN